MSDRNYDELMNHANNWRYLMTLASDGLSGREALAHSRRTTKGDLDAWLMGRFGLEAHEARFVSNYSGERIDFLMRWGEVKWVASRPAPTWEEYPELREYVG